MGQNPWVGFIREFRLTEWEKTKLGERRMGLTVKFLWDTLPDEVILLHPCNMGEKEAIK